MNKNKEILSKKYIRYIGVVLIISMMISVMTACGGNRLSNGTYELVDEPKIESVTDIDSSSIAFGMLVGDEFQVRGNEITGKFFGGLGGTLTYPYTISDGKIDIVVQGQKWTADFSAKGNTIKIGNMTYKKK